VQGRIIDLSYVAARKLGVVASGTAPVEVVALTPGRPEPQLQEAGAEPRPLAPPSRSGGGDASLYLQVGAFSSRLNAERLSHRLQDIELPGIEIQQGYSDQRAVYRVRIGPLVSVEDADRMAEALTRFGIRRSHVVVD
jgi:rare lipoprotein A